MRAVLERDYVAESVRSRAFLARTASGSAAAAILVGLALSAGALGGTNWDQVGGTAFRVTTAALFVFLCATTPLLVVGSLMAERQGNTLEILLTTPEGARGAAAGKLLSRLGTVLGWTAAAIPPLTVTVLFGGTSWRTLGNTGMALFGTALELGAWGLLVSSIVRKPATAAILVYLLPGAHWWAAGYLQHEAGPSFWGTLLAASGPFGSLDLGAWDAFLARPGTSFLASLVREPGLAYLLGAGALALLSIPLAAAGLLHEGSGWGSTPIDIPRSRADGRLRAWLTGGNPVAWKESLLHNTAWSRFLYYLVIGLLLLGEGCSMAMLSMNAWSRESDCAYLALVAVVLMAMAALQGAASMSYEKSGGTFDLLRVSPMTPAEIARGKILGTLLGMGFLLLVPAAHLAMTTLGGIHEPATAVVGSVAAILLTANAAVHGLTWGTVARTPATALIGGGSLVIFAFAGWWALCALPFLLAGMRLMKRDDTSEYFEIIVVPAVLCGSPFIVFWFLLPAMDAAAGGRAPASLAGWGLLVAVSMVLCVFYLVYRWRHLPEVLGREMARMAEGGAPRWLAGGRVGAHRVEVPLGAFAPREPKRGGKSPP